MDIIAPPVAFLFATAAPPTFNAEPISEPIVMAFPEFFEIQLPIVPISPEVTSLVELVAEV
jgi:hypothetical protein